MKYTGHTKFPIKKCLIATLCIILVFIIILGLLYSIIYGANIPDKSYIFLIVWSSMFTLSLLVYWIYQIIKYIKTRKDEK